MKKEVTVVQEYSFPLGAVVFAILLVMKLLGEIEMHWFWVLTSWIWVPVLMLLSVLVLVFIFGAAVVIAAALLDRR